MKRNASIKLKNVKLLQSTVMTCYKYEQSSKKILKWQIETLQFHQVLTLITHISYLYKGHSQILQGSQITENYEFPQIHVKNSHLNHFHSALWGW